jgi:hypothetical protein
LPSNKIHNKLNDLQKSSQKYKHKITNTKRNHKPTPNKLSKQNLINKHNLPQGLLAITNSGIHNLTAPEYGLCLQERVISSLEELILSLGPDFIPLPPPITNEDLVVSLIDYKQRVRKKYSSIVNNTENKSDPLGKLFLQGQTMAAATDNKCSSKPLEHYLQHIQEAFLPPPLPPDVPPEFIFYTNHPLDQNSYTINYDNIQRFVEHCQQNSGTTSLRTPVTLINHAPPQQLITTNSDRQSKHHNLALSSDPTDPNPVFRRADKSSLTTPNQTIITAVLDKLRKDKSIVINNTDKNLGLAIMPTEWYIAQAEEHLKNPLNYVRIHNVPTATAIFDILIAQLQWIGMYDKYRSPISKFLFALDPRFDKSISATAATPLSTFYMLPKVHKPKIATRPIVASIGSLTYNASKYVDFVLQKVIRFFPSILLNSLELNRHIALTAFPKDIILFSSDVSALYPSIDIEDGIIALRRAITVYNEQQANFEDTIDTEFIIALSTWILNNNYLEFGNSNWKQISGTAMGTPMAVVFANLYLLVLEWETLELLGKDANFLPPLLYVRFIDDIFLIARSQEEGDLFLTTLGTRRRRIVLETKSGQSVDFLDLTISVASRETDTLLNVAIYQKPMNRYLYIPPFSYHQQAMFKAFIFSEIRRYRLSCTLDTDFEHTCSQFNQRLIQRGYAGSEFIESKQRFNLSRMDILFTGDCKQFYLKQQNGDNINLIIDNNLNFLPFRKLIQESSSAEITPLIFKLASTPRFSTVEIKKNLALDIDKHGFVFDQFPHALEQFSIPPILCRTRTTKIQDILIRSKFKHDLPSNF